MKKLAIMYHFFSQNLRLSFFLIPTQVDSKSLLANINHTDHPSYVLFPIMCTSTVDSYDIFIYNLMSEYIKK